MLHIISKVPLTAPLFDRLGTHASDSVIVIGDAVITLMRHGEWANYWDAVLANMNVSVLAVDLALRGIGEADIVSGLNIVDYSGFVDLTVDHSVMHSWH
jgi:tRNA 2-thiouridine synthesizing protein B